MTIKPKARDNAGTNAIAMPAKEKAAKRSTKASRANGTAKPSEPTKVRAKSGKPPRHQPREQTFLPEHSGIPHNSSPLDFVLNQLDDVTESSPGQWAALCPAHLDSSPSLSIGEGDDGRVLLTCHRGCNIGEICEALHIEQRDLFPCQQHVSRNGRPKVPPRRPTSKIHKQKTPAGQKGKNTAITLRTAAGAKQDWAAHAKRYEAALPKRRRLELAETLGVTPKSLRLLHVGSRMQADGPRFTFPECNACGEIVGISTRPENGGKKKVIGGSKRGLYIPPGWQDRKGPIFVVEGASDTATLVTLGLAGIGRPSATGGVDKLADLLADLPAKRAIIVLAEYDMKRDGSWPGLDGAKQVAKKLSNMLGRKVRWALPPGGAKDIRVWLQQQNQESSDAE